MQLNVRRIKIAMIDKEMRNTDLAKALDVTPTTLARWFEHPDRPQLVDVTKLAEVLDLSGDEIVI